MRKTKKNQISLKKVVIARINPDAMKNIRGGDCIPTSHQTTRYNC